MESRINRLIRELLKKFGIKTNKVIGKWNLIGHLKNLFSQELKREKGESWPNGFMRGFDAGQRRERKEMGKLFKNIIDDFVINRRELHEGTVVNEVLDFDWTDKIKKYLRKQLKKALDNYLKEKKS